MAFSITQKKIAANTIYQLVGKLTSLLITVGATIIITHSYGRELFGQFSLMQTWPALFFVIVDFGINAIATRELSKDWTLASKYFGNILLIRVLMSLVIIGLLMVSLIFFPYNASLKLGIVLSLALVLTQSLYTTTNIIFQVKLRYDLSTIGYVVGYALILVLVAVCAYLRLDIKWLSFSYVVGGALTFLVNLRFIKKLGISVSLRFDRDVWRYLIVSSLPLGLMFIFSQINFKSDSILLSVMNLPVSQGFSNDDAVALYALPYKIFEVSLVLPTFFMNSVYPVMVRHLQESKEKLLKTLFSSIKALSLLAIAVSLIGYFFSPLAIKLLGGEGFEASIPVLRILLVGLILYNLTQPLSWILVTLGYQRYLPGIYLVSAIFNVVANLIFIPKYSFYSSAVITHASEFLVLMMLVAVLKYVWKKPYVS